MRGVEPGVLAKIRTYAKLFWVNNGPHSAITSQKQVLTCSVDEFARAVQAAETRGARLPARTGESTADMLRRMQPILFDPAVDAQATTKAPGPGRDILQASANNFYEGVTLADLEGFRERYPLNSKLIKLPDGKLQEVVWRPASTTWFHRASAASQSGHVSARSFARSSAIWRRRSLCHAQDGARLGALIQYYRTGSPIDLRAYHVAWVADDDSPVDTINGFVEVYVDPRGQKGSWEGIVYFNDPHKMDLIRKIADEAQWFEEHMPYDPKYRKPEVRGISAKAIQVVMETGDSGPVTPIGINLPNPGDIREQYGSKSVSLSNVIEARDKSDSGQIAGNRRGIRFEKDEAEREAKWKNLVLDLEVNMHEVIGHASGRVSESLKVDPASVIKEYYSALEEARADLIALWFMGDPKLVELGLVPGEHREEIERTAYEMYTRNALAQLRRVPTGTQLEEDHMRNRQLIVHWLLEHTHAVDVRRRDGKTFYVMTNAAEWKAGIGRLLAEVQRIKSEGDREGAKNLVEKYGTRFEPALRDEILSRYQALDRPAYIGFVMPELTAVRDDSGAITDVRISYPCDFEAQMLEWSGRRGGS